jgi:hypothetical protein
MQAAAHLIEQLTTQLETTQPTRPFAQPVIEPTTITDPPRWSANPLCDGADEIDEDEAYFLGDEEEDDADDDDDDYDEDDEDDNLDLDEDDDDDFDDDVNLDEEDF